MERIVLFNPCRSDLSLSLGVGFFYILELKNFRWSVFLIYNRFHLDLLKFLLKLVHPAGPLHFYHSIYADPCPDVKLAAVVVLNIGTASP